MKSRILLLAGLVLAGFWHTASVAAQYDYESKFGSFVTAAGWVTGCNSGTVKYDITSLGIAGVIPTERIALDNVALCESQAGE